MKSQNEAPTPFLTARLLFISMHLLCVHLTTLKINSVSQTPLNFEQRTSLEAVPVPICIRWDANMEPVVTAHYWVVQGCTATTKKEQVVTGSLGRSGLTWAILNGLTLPKCVFHVCIFAWPGFTHNVVSLEMHMCL